MLVEVMQHARKHTPEADPQCLGKQPFANLALAEQIAHRQSQRRDKAVVAYRCAVCNFWHIGQNNRFMKKWGGK